MTESEITALYETALDELHQRHGVDAALSAAAVTLAYYCGIASSGFTRRREPILIVPADIETEHENAP